MRINVITEVGSPGQRHERVQKVIPPGSWGVIVIRQMEDVEPAVMSTTRSTSFDFVGKEPHEEILTHSYHPAPDGQDEFHEPSGLTVERVLYWSDEPFIVIERWEDPLQGEWARPACRITEHGLTSKMPILDLPKVELSLACSYGGKPTKWVRLADLAERCGLDPLELMKRHAPHLQGYNAGVYIVRAADADELMALEEHSHYHTTWTIPDWKEFYSSDPSDAWVRLHFAHVVMYFHMLNWHEQFKKAASA